MDDDKNTPKSGEPDKVKIVVMPQIINENREYKDHREPLQKGRNDSGMPKIEDRDWWDKEIKKG